MRDTRAVVGMGCTMVGLLLILGSTHARHPLVYVFAELLVAIGFILLIVHFWTLWRK